MKQVLSSILAGIMLISSIGLVSAFADESETINIGIIDSISEPDTKNSDLSTSFLKNYITLAKDYPVGNLILKQLNTINDSVESFTGFNTKANSFYIAGGIATLLTVALAYNKLNNILTREFSSISLSL
ncbi:MAG: hypothetical protein RUMPE_01093 [Eubacteriales bacterium SKADARSKE-1]|nr:hypothetical protein [Eubacteriales bacterium SKADARSKE-1]